MFDILIDDDDCHTRIFQKFYQADASHAAEGNGITEFSIKIPKEQYGEYKRLG